MNERQKELKRQYLAAERQRERALLPLSDAELEALLDHLDDRLGAGPCDHSLGLTGRWLAERGRGDEVLDGLRELGAHCDCEVLANVDLDRFA